MIHLVRSESEREKLHDLGIEHVLMTGDGGFETGLGHLTADLNTTAVFDGLGGTLTGRLAPQLPMNTVIYIYGVLGRRGPDLDAGTGAHGQESCYYGRRSDKSLRLMI